MELQAYEVGYPPMKIIPSPPAREWMEQTHQHFANRCLPLLQGNQSGWVLLNPIPFRAIWNGGTAKSCIEIVSLDPAQQASAISHFGHGVLTFTLAHLFRTPSGYNLLVRGPANLPKDGIAPLEGLVESDNDVVATFTMNWKFTHPCTITFARDEPFCMIVPHKRSDLEEWNIVCLPANADTELQKKYQEWSVSRLQFNSALDRLDKDAVQQKWQKDYFQSAEQTKRRLACPMHKG